MGWIAREKSNFAVVEAFNTDFMELFEAKPDETLKVMFAQDFLLIEMCTYLAKYFFFEKNDPQGYQAFEDRHRAQMNAVLGRRESQTLSRRLLAVQTLKGAPQAVKAVFAMHPSSHACGALRQAPQGEG